MSDSSDTDNVDVEHPRPAGHFQRFNQNEWHYVCDELARTISLGPATDGKDGDDWILSLTPEREDPNNREKMFLRFTPRALHELYIETKDISTDARQAGQSAECGLCGDQVDLDDAWPDNRDRPCHRNCYADAFGRPPWY